MTRFVLFLLLTVFLRFTSSCSGDANISSIEQITYGTSFGMCVGYCNRQVRFSSDSMYFKCSGVNEQLKSVTKSIDVGARDSIKALLNSELFFDLPETIGCPDCADGGAEWLEVKLMNGKIHKVKFEYSREPLPIKDCIVQFRKIMSKHDCN